MKKTWRAFLQSKPFLIGLFFLGLFILVYPLISDAYYRVEHEELIAAEKRLVAGLSEDERQSLLEKAHAYNQGLWNAGGEGLFSGERLHYIARHASGIPSFFREPHSMGTLDIPKIRLKLPVFYGVSDSILEQSLGLMPQSSIPVGGKGSHAVITGHRGLPRARLFRDLGELKVGDLFFFHVMGETLAYEVDETVIISPTDFQYFALSEEDAMSLLTCHPYMINSERMVVHAHRVEYTEETREVAEAQRKANLWRDFFVRYREYIIGFGIFAGLVLIENKRRKRSGKHGETKA